MQNRKSGGHRLRWDDARILSTLLVSRSMVKAGEKLGLDASTVARRLGAMERALGARLFDRTPDGVVPTALARALAPHAEAMEHAAIGLALAAEGRESAPEGSVVISAPPGYAEYLLAPALPRLLGAHPGIRVTLQASPQSVDLMRREADLALRLHRPTAGDLVTRKLAPMTASFLASPEYAGALGEIDQLGQARWITWGPDLEHLPAARFVAEHVPCEAVVLRTSHLGTQVAAAEAGLGLIVADESLTRARRLTPACLSTSLRRQRPLDLGTLWLVGHRAMRDIPRIRAVWEFVIEEVRRLGDVGSGQAEPT
jgi:DNA-binding transcriptional LysR family regulator